MTDTEIVERLREVYREREALKQSVQQEMSFKAQEGVLWTNNRCADWDGYVRASSRFDELVHRWLA